MLFRSKNQQNKNNKRTFTPNNYYNSLTGEPRGKSANGEPPKYSNGQILTRKNLIKTNKINNNDNEVNSTWLFSWHYYSIYDECSGLCELTFCN